MLTFRGKHKLFDILFLSYKDVDPASKVSSVVFFFIEFLQFNQNSKQRLGVYMLLSALWYILYDFSALKVEISQ